MHIIIAHMMIENNMGLLIISGKNAKKLLQGQLTCDLDEVNSEVAKLGAHCNHQGRIISLFRIFLYNDAYYLFMPDALISLARLALQKYAIFYQVTFDESKNFTIHNALDFYIQPNWKQAEIQQGVAMIYPETSELFLPHDLNLPKLHGVSFTKGCYTGQEIVARMEHLGKLKKSLKTINITTDHIPQRGSTITHNNLHGILVDYAAYGQQNFLSLVLTQEH